MANFIDVNRRFIASLRDEPEQMLQPITGYEKEPLVSLEQACEPLEGILGDELKQNVMIAKENSMQQKEGLTSDESAAIHLYTMQWTVYENSLFAVLNRTLRTADRGKLRQWFKYLKLFLTAFFKLPAMGPRTVYRGVPEDLSGSYPQGRKFTWWSITSCTTSLKVLESPFYVGASGTRTMFHIETSQSKTIRSHSYYQYEDEVLLPPGIYLEVVGHFTPAVGLTMVQLRETQPPYKMLAEPFDFHPAKNAASPSPDSSAPQFRMKSSLDYACSEERPLVRSNDSPYAKRQLNCKGRACIKCGFCRDWRWRSYSGRGKIYKKRESTLCTANSYSFGLGYYYYHDGDRLCECDDNVC